MSGSMFLRRPGLMLAITSGVTAILLTGCSPNISGSVPVTFRSKPAPSSIGPTSASSMQPAEQSALAAYLGMWEDFVSAARTSDWRSPKLGEHATGAALSTLTRGLYADHYNGLISRGSPTHDARVLSGEPASNPTTVIITDCSDSTHALKYSIRTGQRADDGPGGRRLINATVHEQADKSWKVTDFGVQGLGTC